MNFKKARLAAGLTLDEAAKKLGYDHTAIVGWEKGKWLPRAAKLPEIAKVYGCTVDELLKRRKTDERQKVKRGAGRNARCRPNAQERG